MEGPRLYIATFEVPLHPLTRRKALAVQRQQVQHLLEKITPRPRLQHHKGGKPYLANEPEMSVSVSHTAGFALVGVAPIGSQIGVDIEVHSQKAEQLAHRFCSPHELHLLKQHGYTPVVLWSAKESVYKVVSAYVSGFGKQIVLQAINPPVLTFLVIHDTGQQQQVCAQVLHCEQPTVTYALTPMLLPPKVLEWE